MEKNAINKPLDTSAGIHLMNLSNYKTPNLRKAVWQIFNSVVPYFTLWAAMIILLHQGFPYWMVLLLSVIAAGFLLRIFIIFHDCCHRSFFASKKVNTILGYIFGVLSFSAYEEWKYLHLKHHGTTGNLDKRGNGDIWTKTVEEYISSSSWEKLQYRVVRNPMIMLGIGPIFYFVISQRFWHRNATARQKLSVLITNLFLLLIVALSYFSIGLSTYVMIQAPIILIAGAIGIWLFYVQHQFEGVYWSRQEDWDPTRAALEGSSYYKLPRLLQWMSGNIGFHHIHHIRPQIPNYNLEKCFNDVPEFQSVEIITLRKSLTSLFLNLWHEQQSKMISFRMLKTMNRLGMENL